jgi:hypothetical protein
MATSRPASPTSATQEQNRKLFVLHLHDLKYSPSLSKFDTINAVDFSASNAFEHRNLRDLLLIYLQNDFQRPDSCIFGEILTIGAFLSKILIINY